MKHAFGKQAKRAGIVLAAVGALAVLGIGTAQAQTITSATFFLGTSDEGGPALVCAWTETGLPAGQIVHYQCGALLANVQLACPKGRGIDKKTVTNVVISLPGLDPMMMDMPIVFTASANGVVNGTGSAEIDTDEVMLECGGGGGGMGGGGGGGMGMPVVTAVRLCQLQINDTTNGVSATQPELFQQLIKTGVKVPACP